MKHNPLNKWKYEDEGTDVCYGEEIVYKKAAEFLGDTCEDWGCGTGWARQYFKNYTGLDGSLSGYTKKVTDLTQYTSYADNIMLRQVLEHNYEWKKVLANVSQSFQKKLFIGIHTPFVNTTYILSIDEENNMPNVSFRLDDILAYFPNCKIRQETIPTHFEYGTELLLYIEK